MEACNSLAEDGYEVVHISDVIDGRYQWKTWEGKNSHGVLGHNGTTWGGLVWGYGYGYSVTDGVVITARLAKV